jgi:preprotein translocase subunit SecD
VTKLKPVLTSFVVSIIALVLPLFTTPSQQFVLSPATDANIDSTDLVHAQEVINERLDYLNLPGWPRTALKNQNIIVTVPKTAKKADLIRLLTQEETLQLIDTGVEFPLIDGVQKVQSGLEADPSSGIFQTLLTQADFVNAQAVESEEDEFGLEVTLTKEAADRFATYMADRRGVYICFTIDSTVVGCPIIKLTDNAQLQILQGPTEILVDDSVIIGQINTGTMPIPLVFADTNY